MVQQQPPPMLLWQLAQADAMQPTYWLALPIAQQAAPVLNRHQAFLAPAPLLGQKAPAVSTSCVNLPRACLADMCSILAESKGCSAWRAQMITKFYQVGLLTAAATLCGGCLVLPTMARNALRSTVSHILTVRMRAQCGARNRPN